MKIDDRYEQPNTWREAGPFSLSLTFQSAHSTRGSSGASFVDDDGDDHWVLTSEFAAMIPHMQKGRISGKFGIQKRGGFRYGLRLIESDP